MKKALSILLSLIMAFSAFSVMPFSAFALDSSGRCGNNVYWNFDSASGALTLSGTGDTWDYTSDIEADPECNSPFYENEDIKNIIVESGITGLGDYLFNCCYNVESISLPEGLTKIGKYALTFFYKIESITLPSSVRHIGAHAFTNCQSLKSIIIPDGVTSIESNAFLLCYSLKYVVIPKSVTSVGEDAFSNCGSLTGVYYYGSEADKSNMTISSSGNRWLTDAAWHYNCRSGKCGDNVFYLIDGETLTLSGTGATWDYNWSDNKSPFYNSDTIETITVGDGITRIGNALLFDCNSLKPFTLPDTVTSLGDYAFDNCTGLDNLTLPDSITEIGEFSFVNCYELESITLPAKLETIGAGTFSNCEKLSAITIPESVTTIGSAAFGFCNSLQSVNIPKDVTTIGAAPFYSCESLASITVDADNPNYSADDGLLYNKDKTVLLQYPGGRTAASFTVPVFVTTIGEASFAYENDIRAVVIHKDVSSIEHHAFYECSLLKDVYYGGTKSEWETLSDNIGNNNDKLITATIHYWEAVSFNGNGASNTMAPHSDYTEFTYALPACTFVKDGRTFYKWQVGDELKAPEETIAVNDSVKVKAIWKYTNATDYDATVDESSTHVFGTLYITDTRTGEKYDYNLQALTSVASSYDNAYNAQVQSSIDDVTEALANTTKLFAGDYEVTVVSNTVSDPTVRDSKDNRAETKYYGFDENLPSGLAATDANGDYCYYNYKSGNYYNYWKYDITYVAEFTSLQPVVKLDDWTYGAPANVPTVENNNGGGRVEYFYKAKDADDSKYSKDSPTKPGEYTVKAEIAAGGIYETETVTADFTIAPAEVTITADNQKSYRGSALKDLTYKLTGGYVDGDELGIKLETNADINTAGEYDITVTAANDCYTITLLNGKYTVV
ncbi:MAG: leucine-rich repeat protein, partial [Eubacterium sp.]|nr:leucine-rich repeat protein [Eubacterium sp.]